jgi:hypothetical protein
MGETKAPAGKVMRHPSIPMRFQRTLPSGEVLVFEPGVPVELDSLQMEGVLNDIGTALVVVETDHKGRARIDWDLTKAVRDNETPPERSDDGEVGVAFEVSDELMNLLEIHAESFPELSPVGVQLFLDNGGDLESLDGFTPELAAELRDIIASKLADSGKLVEAGFSDDIVEKLLANVTGEANVWLLDPEQLRSKVAEGFRLDSLNGIGPVAAKKIRSMLGV